MSELEDDTCAPRHDFRLRLSEAILKSKWHPNVRPEYKTLAKDAFQPSEDGNQPGESRHDSRFRWKLSKALLRLAKEAFERDRREFDIWRKFWSRRNE